MNDCRIDINQQHTSCDYNTPLNTLDGAIANQYRPSINHIFHADHQAIDHNFNCSYSDHQLYSFTDVMTVTGTMVDTDCGNADVELQEKINRHKTTNNFGFTSLQKRIERVKCDLLNLTNKLNSTFGDENVRPYDQTHFSYYNLGFGNMIDGDNNFSDEDSPNHHQAQHENDLSKTNEKTWKCPSDFSGSGKAGAYSEFSESTKRVLDKLLLKNSESMNDTDGHDELMMGGLDVDEDDDLELEEDDLEFTFTSAPCGLIQSLINKGVLPAIEELEEVESSVGGSESPQSTLMDGSETFKDHLHMSESSSFRSLTNTSDSFITAISNAFTCVHSGDEIFSENSDDVEEYYSDFARCSVSSHSSKESLHSQEGMSSNTGIGTVTLRQENIDDEDGDHCSNLKNFECLTKSEDYSNSDDENDDSVWNGLDTFTDKSSSLNKKDKKLIAKSSLPDLLESGGDFDQQLITSPLNKNFNKSTDLDEIIIQQSSPHLDTPSSRLSVSLCNLSVAKSVSRTLEPNFIFTETVSFGNLLETDIDSGYESIYQPFKETEILPTVDFSCSMVNVNQDKGHATGSTSLADRLKSRASSIPELRIANSVSKLNIPDWLNFLPDENSETTSQDVQNFSFPSRSSDTCSSNLSRSSTTNRYKSLPKETKNICTFSSPQNLKSPQKRNPIVLPSQILRNSTLTKKLQPINGCKARELLLLPNRLSATTDSINF